MDKEKLDTVDESVPENVLPEEEKGDTDFSDSSLDAESKTE